jgi:hypothetical protein
LRYRRRIGPSATAKLSIPETSLLQAGTARRPWILSVPPAPRSSILRSPAPSAFLLENTAQSFCTGGAARDIGNPVANAQKHSTFATVAPARLVLGI